MATAGCVLNLSSMASSVIFLPRKFGSRLKGTINAEGFAAGGAGDGAREREKDPDGRDGGDCPYAGGDMSNLGNGNSSDEPPAGPLLCTVTCTFDPRKLNSPFPGLLSLRLSPPAAWKVLACASRLKLALKAASMRSISDSISTPRMAFFPRDHDDSFFCGRARPISSSSCSACMAQLRTMGRIISCELSSTSPASMRSMIFLTRSTISGRRERTF